MRTATLYDGDVVVRGPAGYCIDRRSLRKRASEGFVLLASCEALSGLRGVEVEPVIMTLTVSPGQAGTARPTVDEIAASMPDAQVLDRVELKHIALVHFANGGDQALAGKDPKHWRGAMALNGHLIGLALYARAGSETAERGGQRLLSELARNMMTSSPVRPLIAPDAEETPVAPDTPEPGTAATGPFGLLLGGLFPDSG